MEGRRPHCPHVLKLLYQCVHTEIIDLNNRLSVLRAKKKNDACDCPLCLTSRSCTREEPSPPLSAPVLPCDPPSHWVSLSPVSDLCTAVPLCELPRSFRVSLRLTGFLCPLFQISALLSLCVNCPGPSVCPSVSLGFSVHCFRSLPCCPSVCCLPPSQPCKCRASIIHLLVMTNSTR